MKTKHKAFLSTLVNENSRPRAKRRNTTPNCAKVSTCSKKIRILISIWLRRPKGIILLISMISMKEKARPCCFQITLCMRFELIKDTISNICTNPLVVHLYKKMFIQISKIRLDQKIEKRKQKDSSAMYRLLEIKIPAPFHWSSSTPQVQQENQQVGSQQWPGKITINHSYRRGMQFNTKYISITNWLPHEREYDTTTSSWNNYNHQIFNQSAVANSYVMDHQPSVNYICHIKGKGIGK
jgi:hypothetical protein